MKFLFSFVFIAYLLSFSVAFADYPKFLDGNRNYILGTAHMGLAQYLDRSSLEIVKAEHPFYLIYIEYLSVPDADRGNSTPTSRGAHGFFYDFDSQSIYIYSDYLQDWSFCNPEGSYAEGYESALMGDSVFFMAYGRHFYRNSKFWGFEP